jgi:hypothetical protein
MRVNRLNDDVPDDSGGALLSAPLVAFCGVT